MSDKDEAQVGTIEQSQAELIHLREAQARHEAALSSAVDVAPATRE